MKIKPGEWKRILSKAFRLKNSPSENPSKNHHRWTNKKAITLNERITQIILCMKKRIYLQYHGELIVVHFIYGIISIVRISRVATFWQSVAKFQDFGWNHLEMIYLLSNGHRYQWKCGLEMIKKKHQRYIDCDIRDCAHCSVLIQKQWNKLIVCMSPLWFRFSQKGWNGRHDVVDNVTYSYFRWKLTYRLKRAKIHT